MHVAKNNKDTQSWKQSYLMKLSFSPHPTSALRQKQNKRRNPPGLFSLAGLDLKMILLQTLIHKLMF